MTRIDLDMLLAHAPECDAENNYRLWCEHDELGMAVREYLIMGEDYDPSLADEDDPQVTPEIVAAVNALDSLELFAVRLEYSLCPLHARDYAICFDDDDEECRLVREMFPEHDT